MAETKLDLTRAITDEKLAVLEYGLQEPDVHKRWAYFGEKEALIYALVARIRQMERDSETRDYWLSVR